MLQRSTVVGCEAQALVTVENSTSFAELTSIRPPRALLIFTGGFASPTLLRLIQSILAFKPSLRLLHWGDLDAGGLRILRHLRTHLGAVAPMAMDARTFQEFEGQALPLTSTDRVALTNLHTASDLADCTDLIDVLLRSDQKLEQEAVSAAYVASEMGRYIDG